MKKVAPSLLSADFAKLGDEIRAVEVAGADWIHLDIMDGHFVPNITAGPNLVAAARKVTRLPLDVHLMIEAPRKLIPAFASAGADIVSVHVEAHSSDREIGAALRLIGKCGAKPAIALNPATPLKRVLPFLDDVTMVVVMTVNPGFGGQEFIPSAIRKIPPLREEIDRRCLSMEIEVDGGINCDNIAQVSRSGATVFVAGSAIFGSRNYRETIRKMRQTCVIFLDKKKLGC